MSAESMSLAWKAVVVASGGAMGSLLRLGVFEWVVPRVSSSVWATCVVNVVGCLVFGALKAGVDVAEWGSLETRTFVFFGILGAFTTFSTFEADMFGLWTEGQQVTATLYLLTSVVGGLLAFVGSFTLVARVLG